MLTQAHHVNRVHLMHTLIIMNGNMDYTTNELALINLIGNVNKIFYYVGEEGDLIDRFDLKQLDKAVASFKQSVQLGDSQAQDYEYI